MSKWPISNLRSEEQTGSVNFIPVGSCYARATVTIEGQPIEVFSNHWAHRPGPTVSGAERLRFARTVTQLLQTIDPRTPLVVGGDFNASSRFGPEGLSSSTPEIGELEGAILMQDAAREAGFSTSPYCGCTMAEVPECKRIDFVFYRGPYKATQYVSCDSRAYPSDHGLVEVVLTREPD